MVLAPGAWMQRRDKQVILIQCNTFSELHRVPDTMVYNHNNPRWWGGWVVRVCTLQIRAPRWGRCPARLWVQLPAKLEDRRGSRASKLWPLSGSDPGPSA